MPLGDPDSNREQQGPAALPHLRTATSPAPAPPRPTAADSGGGGTLTPPDSWTASGPFRNAPMRHLLHATPSGTPLASPRSGTPPDDRGGDLEAPLLGRVRGKRGGGAQQQPFDSGGALRAITFGLINTAAGVVSAAGADWGLHAAARRCLSCQLPAPHCIVLKLTTAPRAPPFRPSQPALIAFCAVVFKHPLYHSQAGGVGNSRSASGACHKVHVTRCMPVGGCPGSTEGATTQAPTALLRRACRAAGGAPVQAFLPGVGAAPGGGLPAQLHPQRSRPSAGGQQGGGGGLQERRRACAPRASPAGRQGNDSLVSHGMPACESPLIAAQAGQPPPLRRCSDNPSARRTWASSS